MPTTDQARVAHFDVTGPDEPALHAFYAAVFGWDIASRGPGYALVTTPEGSADGAISEAPESSVTLGITVADLDAALAESERAGGRVTMPATDNGWVVKAQVTDPAGNLLTLIAR